MFRRKQAPPAFVRACTVYLAPGQGVALVAALFNHAGLFAEQPEGVARCERGDPAALGAAVRAALAACRYEPVFDYRDRKRTDWPAFRQSGCRSVRAFEESYVPIGIQGVNDANLSYAVASPPFGRFGLRLEATLDGHAPETELGACIEYVWQEHRRAGAA
jgi:hypothetical protein